MMMPALPRATFKMIEPEFVLSTLGAVARLYERDPAAAERRDRAERHVVAERHRTHIAQWYYDVTPTMHASLGDMYVADPRFASNESRLRHRDESSHASTRELFQLITRCRDRIMRMNPHDAADRGPDHDDGAAPRDLVVLTGADLTIADDHMAGRRHQQRDIEQPQQEHRMRNVDRKSVV